jgi:hypothetical protein
MASSLRAQLAAGMHSLAARALSLRPSPQSLSIPVTLSLSLHTYTYACMHTYVHAVIHAIDTCIHTYIHATHTYTSYIYTVYTYIHTYTHSHIHTYAHITIHTWDNIQVLQEARQSLRQREGHRRDEPRQGLPLYVTRTKIVINMKNMGVCRVISESSHCERNPSWTAIHEHGHTNNYPHDLTVPRRFLMC